MPTIVVIDDDKANNTLIKTMLKEYEVHTAHSAETGIALIRALVPDLILIDIRMPGMDGITATQIIKNDPQLTHIPIIAVTATLVGDVLKGAIEAGCDDYVSKPFKPNDLKTIVQKYLR